MMLVTALNTEIRNYFVPYDRQKKSSEYMKWKSVTSSRFATHKWTRILQTRRIAGKEFPPTLVLKRCFMCFLITTSQKGIPESHQ
jgi:hypothetical protein